MADGRRYGLTPQLNIEQILMEAQHRWLRPAEICEILKNYTRFRIAPEPPNKPPSGSLFLFDRKVLRYFRKDGHNWRKKKDGKTVKEAHERLKAGSVDVLHCYYAHGEDNEYFQRRSYWMLEEDLMHIVLVHYLEVKSSKSSMNRGRGIGENLQTTSANSTSYSDSFTNQSHHLLSLTTDGDSSISGQTSDAESVFPIQSSESDAKFESADNISSSRSGYHSFSQSQFQLYNDGYRSVTDHHSLLNPYSVPPPNNQYDYQGVQTTTPSPELYSFSQEDLTKAFDGSGLGLGLAFNGSRAQFQEMCTVANDVEDHSTTTSGLQTPLDISIASTQFQELENLALDDGAFIHELGLQDVYGTPATIDDKFLLSKIPSGNKKLLEEKGKSLDISNTEEDDGLKKLDSFSRWMCKELEEVEGSQINSSSNTYWSTVDSAADGVLEDSSISPMLSQDQLFSILDYSPSYSYVGFTTKVTVKGMFLKDKGEVERCKWSCMFGEIEVPANLLSDSTLQCYAPSHKPGRVPFYVTCSNRLACSEIREFEFLAPEAKSIQNNNIYSNNNIYNNNGTIDEAYLRVRLENLLIVPQSTVPRTEKNELSYKISALMSEDDEWSNLLKLIDGEGYTGENCRDEVLERMMKEKLYQWLIHKVSEEGGTKGPCVLDREGQGVIHLTAALGYDWAIRPTITAGVNINFRDVHGWTALHWAAFCGRERTVVALIALGAAAGALTDPTLEFPSGRTPADLASFNGHKGISGFLALSSLNSHLEILTLKDKDSPLPADMAQIRNLLPADVDLPPADVDLSMKDSLTAVRSAAQAAARIYQVFRVQSFQRKKLAEEEELEKSEGVSGISDERALSLVTMKSARPPPAQRDIPLHEAAVRIQNKFRGWKGRKDFLLIRQRIVKIQAHVRGHQVRKHYKIIWSVGIMEKIILRWRRKGSGLRGFRSDAGPSEPGPSAMQTQPVREDEYDFLQKGKRQTEERLQKALARVKSMAQYPEARDQYSRILTVVTRLQESQAMQERMLKESEEADGGCDFMAEFRELWEDDTPMPGFL